MTITNDSNIDVIEIHIFTFICICISYRYILWYSSCISHLHHKGNPPSPTRNLKIPGSRDHPAMNFHLIWNPSKNPKQLGQNLPPHHSAESPSDPSDPSPSIRSIPKHPQESIYLSRTWSGTRPIFNFMASNCSADSGKPFRALGDHPRIIPGREWWSSLRSTNSLRTFQNGPVEIVDVPMNSMVILQLANCESTRG